MIIHRPGQRLHFVPGIGINVIVPKSAAAAGWWLSGGISAADVAGVWQAKGAASLAASYLRLAGDQGYANIDPAVVGIGVAPTWNVTDGWIGAGTSWLNTGIVPSNQWSAIVKFSGLANENYPFGSMNTGTIRFAIAPSPSSLPTMVAYQNGNYILVAPQAASGTFAIAGPNGYRNGILDTSGLTGNGATGKAIYIMALNFNGTTYGRITGSVQHFVVYKTVITGPQVLAVSTAMP